MTLEHAGLDPSYLIGGDLNETGGGARHGDGDLFVFEADESDGSFLLGAPWTGVVTNIEVDHVDFYPGGLPEIEAAFARVRRRVRGRGRVRRRPGRPTRAWRARASSRRPTASTDDVDLRLTVEALGPEGARGTVRFRRRRGAAALAHRRTPQPAERGGGRSDVAARAGVPLEAAAEAMASFEGVHRRFELRGDGAGCRLLRRLRAHADGDGGDDRRPRAAATRAG